MIHVFIFALRLYNHIYVTPSVYRYVWIFSCSHLYFGSHINIFHLKLEVHAILSFDGITLLESFPVRGSFAVQFGDHLGSWDHLRVGIICGPVHCPKRGQKSNVPIKSLNCIVLLVVATIGSLCIGRGGLFDKCFISINYDPGV